MLKDVRQLYKPYYPSILKENNGFEYELNEENVFGNLYYSMNQDLLKGKSSNINIIPEKKNFFESNSSPKFVPFLRYKNAL